MEYNFREIESKWRSFWAENKTFKAEDHSEKPKFYVLDMFPYPSGAGLHVGHPLGYIASDIYSRYKRLQGFNVLHPMGYDSFGLPAEQYAIQTGQHPAITTITNIDGGTDKEGNVISGYRKQLDIMGFSFDWDREVRTSSPEYYKWTQWIFKQLFDCWYNNTSDKAERIADLISTFETEGNSTVNATHDYEGTFSAEEWKAMSEADKSKTLMSYRLTYLADSWVNWCPALGTVLANDEVVNGVSERGGHPVVQKLMRQWSMRIKAYAERLLTGLDTVDWTDSIKDQQRNWIGKSQGASVHFKVDGSDHDVEVFTTRADTIYGVSFMVLAPEHPFVDEITTPEFADGVAEYKKQASLKSERDRQADVKNITGQNTGAFAIHPFTGDKVQIWIGDYVLASYGTGAVMAVPCGDQRDWDFAKHFGIEIINIFEDKDISEEAYSEKDAVIANSDFLNGLNVKKAGKLAIYEIEKRGFGKGKTQYRLRDAVFSRQRYWGEPFPVYYKDEIPHLVSDESLPITLPEVDKYLPTEDGEPPLARAEKGAWNHSEGDRMEFNTMPGWAGSSWYFLRYMDPKNDNEFVAKDKVDYWKNVDLYIGGSEHATGHLLYSRFWTKFLYDLDLIPFEEPFQKMINQGMILGRSSLGYKIELADDNDFKEELSFLRNEMPALYISAGMKKLLITNSPELSEEESILKARIDREMMKYEDLALEMVKKEYPNTLLTSVMASNFAKEDSLNALHIDIKYVDNDVLDIKAASKDPLFGYLNNAHFILEDDGSFQCAHEVEKMSKRWYNVQTPDELVERYGADTLRMYEMFLGPLEQSKPWDTQGISGVHNFLKKLWRLFHDQDGNVSLSEGEADPKALKTLHKTIKKIGDDLDRFSFNTGVSNFMICVNELTDQKCNNKGILQELVVLISPYAPHVAEELWVKLGNEAGTLSYTAFPEFNEANLIEANHSYPVSFNGKMRFKIELPTAMSKEDVEKEVLAHEVAQKWLEGNAPKKVIVVHGRIVNIVV
ncbi:MAG: leucyl-tRNA synthetase [Crocinitomicaceae bacterium]|jgi:leucyl-tRNA synthetase